MYIGRMANCGSVIWRSFQITLPRANPPQNSRIIFVISTNTSPAAKCPACAGARISRSLEAGRTHPKTDRDEVCAHPSWRQARLVPKSADQAMSAGAAPSRNQGVPGPTYCQETRRLRLLALTPQNLILAAAQFANCLAGFPVAGAFRRIAPRPI